MGSTRNDFIGWLSRFLRCRFCVAVSALCPLLARQQQLESHENAETRFGFSVSRVRGDGTVIGTSNGNRATIPSRLTVGADGAFSSVRQSLVQLANREALNSTVSFISSGYREFSLEPSPEGDFRLQPAQGLHIWPRGEFMFIGLPNPDRSFTMTLFAPWRGPSGLLDAETDDEVGFFFATEQQLCRWPCLFGPRPSPSIP